MQTFRAFDCLVAISGNLDRPGLQANIRRMQASADRLGVALRPHLKTLKSATAAQALVAAGARGITVSTLKEAGYFLDHYWGPEPLDVRIEFSARSAPFILERKWHPSQKVSKNADGSIVLSLKIRHMLEVQRWVMSHGEDARVLEPRSQACFALEALPKRGAPTREAALNYPSKLVAGVQQKPSINGWCPK